MRRYTSWQGLKSDDQGAVAAIGNFDGVHLGHQAILSQVQAISDATSAPSGVITFEPHPRSFFAPVSAPFRIMNPETKAHRLEKLGIERLYELPFDGAMAALEPHQFVADVLVKGLGLSHVIVGADFCFGKNRAGTAETLIELGRQHGFGVTIAELVKLDAIEVSSTAIRNALADGRPRDAAKMLGHWHRIDGQVLGGDRRGREIGYPTANMSIQGLHAPKFGIYAVLVDVLTGPHAGHYHGAASIGVRPTFGENAPNLETFIFDFAGDLYGEELSIAFVDYLRDELKFDGIDPLVAQMDKDCAQARDLLAAL